MKRSLYIVIVLLLIPVFALAWLGMTESGLRWAFQLAKPYLPGELTMSKVEGRLIGPITVSDIDYQYDGTIIHAEQILLEWQPSALLAANIDINRLQIRALNIVLPATEKIEPSSTQTVTLPEIHLPWRVSLQGLVIDGLIVNQNGQHYDAQQIRLSATTLFSQIDIEELSVTADNFSLNIKGELLPTRNYRHQLEIGWQATLPTAVVIKGQGQISGNLQQTHIKQQLSGPLQLTLDGTVNNLLEQLNWQASINVADFDVAKLNAGWPAVNGKAKLDGKGDLSTAIVAGTVDGDYPELGRFDGGFKVRRLADNSIQIDQLMLHTPVSDTRLHGRGQWQPGDNGGDLAVALHWQNLRWPLTNVAWFDSAIGSGWIEGNINHYRFGLATDRLWPQAPPSDWYASADGSLAGITFHSLRVTALEGETIAHGQLDWSPQLVWRAEIEATALDPASLLPQWPGKLNATLASHGQIENGQLNVTADISQLTGTLRNYPVSLRSRLTWRDNGLDIGLFDLHSGTSRISTQGRISETLKLDWAINAPDLAALYPQAQGQLQAEGLLTGPRTTPTIQATLSGQALGLADYQIGTLDAALNIDLLQWQQPNIHLAAQALQFKDYTLQSLVIATDEKQMTAKAVAEKYTAVVELQGRADDQGWRGRIMRADFNSQQFHNWQLKAPTTLNISADRLEFEPLCWLSNDSNICMRLQQNDDSWQATLNAGAMPLMLLGPWLPDDLVLEGTADAAAEIRYQSARLTGTANIQLPPAALNYPLLEGEREHWEYHGGALAVTLDQHGITANADLSMSNGDRLHIEATLPGARLPGLDLQQQHLSAEAQLTIHDLGLVEALLPEVQDLQGEVALNLTASGTLAQPRLSGRAHLLNGALRIPRLGLSITQISLKAQSDGFEKLDFRLDALSGDGKLAISGQTMLERIAGWPTNINIKGEQFEVSRIPEAQVQISPDLQIRLQKREVHIKGDIHIPYAKLQPKDITTAVRVSEDAVIVGGEQPPLEKWAVFTSVRLTLGERVSFFGFGFEGRFGGSLLLNDEPGQLTTATGELNVPEGRYRAYGQRLDIEHGRLLYTGGPLTNPGLDIRAVRYVGNVTTGIKVRGNLTQPQLELFSIPAMGETDTLSYLLLGRPIENATGEEGAMMAKAALALGLSGGDRLARVLGDRFGLDEMRVESSDSGDQASLVMGRYLSPKLYISYGVGLLESVNTFTVRYQISDKWQLKGESGEAQGADILYTIER